jgi:hypothetical protein
MVAATPTGDESLGDLGRQLADDVARLVRLEIALARVQALETGKRLAVSAALLGAAGFFVLLGVVYSLAALPEHFGPVLHDAWVGWAAFGILWFLLAAVGGGLGVRRVRRALREARSTIDAMKEDLEWAKRLSRRDGRSN